MTGEIEIRPTGPIHGTIRPPGSKSITNRALLCAALGRGRSVLTGALISEDTEVMLEALRQLRIGVNVQGTQIEVDGCGGKIPVSQADIYVANSGTTSRFLAASLAIGRGDFRLHGTARMHERPIADLVDALKALGVRAEYQGNPGCLPLVIHAQGLPGYIVPVKGNISSQFLSGLLLAAPYAQRDLQLAVFGELVSVPYVTMTLQVMEAFGVKVLAPGTRIFYVPSGSGYVARQYAIEPDASAASYFFAAAAITGGRIRVEGLSADSLQGDVAFVDCLARMGCKVEKQSAAIVVQGGPLLGIDADMNAISDTVPTLAVVALFAQGPTTIRNVGHIRHKETDRISAVVNELKKLGAQVEEWDDGLRITPAPFTAARIKTYDDHRMAMSFALAGLKIPGVVILDPDCTAKTYPAFFSDLEKVTRS